MPAIASVPPDILKRILELNGWSILDEGKYNWIMVRNGAPLSIPRKGRLVSLPVLDACLITAEIAPGDYFEALEQIGHKI